MPRCNPQPPSPSNGHRSQGFRTDLTAPMARGLPVAGLRCQDPVEVGSSQFGPPYPRPLCRMRLQTADLPLSANLGHHRPRLLSAHVGRRRSEGDFPYAGVEAPASTDREGRFPDLCPGQAPRWRSAAGVRLPSLAGPRAVQRERWHLPPGRRGVLPRRSGRAWTAPRRSPSAQRPPYAPC